MRVLLAPESFTGTLTAGQAAAAMARGWREHAPGDVLDLCPLSDGGPGLLAVLHDGLGGALLAVPVPGDEAAAVLVVDDGSGRTGFVEAAQVLGAHLALGDALGSASSAPLAPLLLAAVDAGCTRVVVGVGGLGVMDGGAGLLGALGAGLRADNGAGAPGSGAPGSDGVLRQGGAALVDLPDDGLAGLAEVRDRFVGIELVAAGDVDPPLLGFSGTAATSAAGLGAGPALAQAIDRGLGRYAQVALDTLGPQRAPGRLVAEPGAGAGGGLVFGLTLLGARREPGTQVVADAVRLADRMTHVDLVVTGEGRVDWRSLRGAVVGGVAHHAQRVGVPVVVLAGQVDAGRRELLSAGVEASYAVAETPAQVAASLADPADTLAARARRVARTWSR